MARTLASETEVEVIDVSPLKNGKKPPFKLGDRFVVHRVSAGGLVILEGRAGFWRPHRFTIART